MGDGTYPGSVSMMTFCGGIVFFWGLSVLKSIEEK